MNGVESITRGWWRPTPGSIYPLLKEMSDQGLVRKRDDGRYELTPKGRTQAEVPFGRRMHGSRSVDEMIGQMNSLVSYIEDVKTSEKEDLGSHLANLRGLAKRLSDLAGEENSDNRD